MRIAVSGLLFLTVTQVAQAQGDRFRLPQFRDFPVTEVFEGKPASPRFDRADSRTIREAVFDSASHGPDFAGHYAIAKWTCGSWCVSIAVLDMKTGAIYPGPFGFIGYGFPIQYQTRFHEDFGGLNQLDYRLGSRLLIARGCPEDKDCATYFYDWTGSGFRLMLILPTYSLYLLPSPVSVSGTVVDEAGNPLEDVWVAHAGDGNRDLKTDAMGRFRFRTQVPAVVFRREDFVGSYFRVRESSNVRITLQGTRRKLPSCNSACLGLGRWESIFCFPDIAGVKASGRMPLYYGYRRFQVEGMGEETGLLHTSGVGYSPGVPFDVEVWSSVDYTETAFIYDLAQINDARGTTVDGLKWRLLGRQGESASYRDLTEKQAAVLDRVLDGVCIKSIQQRRSSSLP